MIYVLTFAVTTLLLYLSSKCKGALKTLLVATGLLIPCLIAGWRDETVGTDVLSYAKWMCIDAQNMELVEFMINESAIANPGWNLFSWVAVNVTGGLPGYLFAIEALCIVPIYFGLHRMCPGYEWAGMLAWMNLWYAFSLNGMRQCVAMGIIFYAMSFVLCRQPFRFSLALVVAYLFHQTAVVGVFIYPFAFLYRYSKSISKLLGRWRSIIVVGLACGILAVCFAFGDRIVLALSVLKESYSMQASRIGENDFSVGGLYLLIVTLMLWSLSRRLFLANSDRLAFRSNSSWTLDNIDIVCAISSFGCLLWQLNLISATLGRIGYYGGVFIPLFISALASISAAAKGLHFSAQALAFMYFVVMTLILGHSGAVPYTSTLLGIG